MTNPPISFEQALVYARLAGRHSNAGQLDSALEDGALKGEQILAAVAAFREGMKARLDGFDCVCPMCHDGTNRIGNNERKRSEYSIRRHDELKAEGLSTEDAHNLIEYEISRGAAQ